MKAVSILFILMFSPLTFGEEIINEFDYSEEVACHKEFKSLGCVDKQDNESSECIEKRLKKVSPHCRSIHNKRKKETK